MKRLALLSLALSAAGVVITAPEDVPAPKKALGAIMNPNYIPEQEKHSSHWRNTAKSILNSKLQEKMNFNKATNGILFIGDGMSVATIMASRVYAGQLEKHVGEDMTLSFENFPISGLAKTYCIDAQVPDSACTATAYLTGVKTKFGTLGMDGNVTRGACHSQLHTPNLVHSIASWAQENGLDTGFVTTTRVTHASPAGLYAHSSERNWECDADIPDECLLLGCKDIAHQLVSHEPGKSFKVILGGGRREFLPNNTNPYFSETGHRADGQDLTEVWNADKLRRNATRLYVTDRTDLMKMYDSGDYPEYLLGLFNGDHMQYHLKAENEPTLAEMTEIAIKMLSRNPKGYFLFVEGGRIDHAHHDNLAHLALDETVEFSKAIGKAKEITNTEDTLIVVSSDHAHTMSVAGYPSRGNDILSIVDTTFGDDGIPYTTISYANGKGVSYGPDGKRIDVTMNSMFMARDPNFAYPGIVPLQDETHGGEDVAVFSLGPWQHLFTASYEQNAIPHMMAYAMCIGDLKHENCNPKSKSTGWFGGNSSSSIKPSAIILLAVIVSAMRCVM